MFTAVAQKNLAGAESYFDEHLAQNDYYAAGEIRPGQWIGAGAERLGLNQTVTREQFRALCENKNPNDDKRLTQRQEKTNQRRVFYDFTCSAPKSVSVLAVTMDDDRLVSAHEEATRIAFRELETFAATRVRKQGNQRDRTTGNLVAAAFTHTSSRALDPLLHTHLTVFNATFDETEKRWKALQAGGIYDAIRYGTAVYRNELAKRVQQIGYRIRPANHGFEIEGVSDVVLKRFSKRSQQRDAVVRELEQKLGRKLSNNAIALAVHQSRAKKIKGISTAEVRGQQLAIHFHRTTHGFDKNETVSVVAVENDSLKVQRSDGTETFFPLGQGSALCNVGERRKLKIAVGDKLLLQANTAGKRFINGELVEVRAIQGDSVLLADGRVIPADYRTFTHGYAMTSHAAQGKTVDEVLLVASSRSLPAINQEQFYVSISRGRERCQIFTDDTERLRSHVTHSSARLAAVEAMPQRDFLHTILQRGNRFMERFRQRIAQSLSIKTTERSSHEIKPTEHQRQSARHISV